MADEILIGSDGAATLEFLRVAVSAASNGANSLVAAVAGKSIRVLSGYLIAAGTVNAKFQSASTDLTGLLPLVAQKNVDMQWSPAGHVETAAGEALNLNLSTTVAVTGWLVYVLR